MLKIRTVSQRGQGMVEYIIILALIAIAAIGVYSLFGKSVRNQASGLAQEFSGNNAQQQIQDASTASKAAAKDANTTKDMSSYNNQNGK